MTSFSTLMRQESTNYRKLLLGGTIFCFFCFFIKFWNIGTEVNLIISTSKRVTNFSFCLTNPSKLITSCTETVMRWVCMKKELKKCNLEETHKLLPADQFLAPKLFPCISHPFNFKFEFTFLLSHIQHSFNLINILILLSFFERFQNFGFYQQLFETGSCIKLSRKVAHLMSLKTAHCFERSL